MKTAGKFLARDKDIFVSNRERIINAVKQSPLLYHKIVLGNEYDHEVKAVLISLMRSIEN